MSTIEPALSPRDHWTERLAVFRTRPRTVAAWLLCNLVSCIVVWGGLTYKADLQRAEAEAALETSAVTLAGSYAEQLARAVSAIDEQTLTVKHYWEQDKTSVNLREQWNKGLFGNQQMNGLAIFDKHGDLESSSFERGRTGFVGTQPFFLAYQNGRASGLKVTPPSPGVISQESIVRFTRDLRNLAGEFDGVVSIGYFPQHFASQFGQSRLADRDFLSIRDDDGQVYISQTRGGKKASGGSFTQQQVFLLANGFSIRDGAAFHDNHPRYVAWARVPDTSLFAVAALSIEDALIPFQATRKDYRRFTLAWVLASCAVFLAGLALFARLVRRSDEAEKVRRTYRLATELAGEGFYMLEPVRDGAHQVVDFRILDCNALAARFVNYEPSALIGKTILDLHSGRYAEKLIALFRRVLVSGFEEGDARVPSASRYNVEWIYRKVVATEGCLAVTVYDITAQKAHEKQLRDIANTDSLTGLPNRHWLTGYLPDALRTAGEKQMQLALLFIDLDNFKTINDTFGHLAGDGALRAAADRIKSVMRPDDSVVRIGGDEFTVILQDVDGPASVALIAERIVDELGKPWQVGDQLLPVLHGSVGISLYPHDGVDVDALLKHADMAMYEAKTQGKSRYAFYRPADERKPDPVGADSEHDQVTQPHLPQ